MQIVSAREFGSIIKRVRRAIGLTQTEVAGACGTGVRFIVDLEHGKPTCELGKALRVAQMLGIKFEVTDAPARALEIDQ